MCSLKSLLVICSLFSVIFAASLNGSIGFPEAEEDPNLVNKDNRQPVYIPSMCAENELYYPGDQKDDWICDCRPGFLYHPKSDACWAAYTKGPCLDGQYLILPQGSAIPLCETNPCIINKLVMFNGKCQPLSTTAPCNHLWPPAVLTINATTLTPNCERINLLSRFGDRPVVVLPKCPPGCKRSVNGRCVPIAG
nr:uncharacterized protein LOC110378588 [Helicoverpa armigera]